MQKLGMKPVPNISRVTIKKSKNVRLSQRSKPLQHTLTLEEEREDAPPQIVCRREPDHGARNGLCISERC